MPESPQHPAPAAPPPRRRGRLRLALLAAAVLAIAAVAAVTLADDGGGDDVAATGAPTSTTRASTTSTTIPPTATTALCIGDSVMLGASAGYLDTLSMCGTVDALQSRQFEDAPATVGAHAPYPAAVVVHLGNNGTVARDDVDAVMAQLSGVSRVVLVTVQLSGTRSWEAQANDEIRAAGERYPNVAVADWKAVADAHPDYTRSDGIHLAPAGGDAYAATIASAL